jgi:multimeric flavodoxin WrbA
MKTSDIVQGQRKYKRIVPSKEDCIYCIVANAESSYRTISLVAVDLSQNGFKFALSPSLTNYFSDGQKLFLKGIGGSLNITFADPIGLSVRWKKHHAKQNLVDVGFEISSISEQSLRQLSELISSDILGSQLKQQSNVLSLFGGHRHHGNTANILGWIEESLRTQGHRVERINLAGRKISGCIKCLECKKTPLFSGCAQKDDAMFIINKILKSDAVIFASPLYYRYLSVQMRALFERFNCLYRGACGTAQHTSFVEGQLQSLVVTSVDPYEDHAEQTARSFHEMVQANKAHSAGKLIVCNCTTPDKLGGQIKAHAAVFTEQIFSNQTAPYALLIPRAMPVSMRMKKTAPTQATDGVHPLLTRAGTEMNPLMRTI